MKKSLKLKADKFIHKERICIEKIFQLMIKTKCLQECSVKDLCNG